MSRPPLSVGLTTVAMATFTSLYLVVAFHHAATSTQVCLGSLALASQLAMGVALYRWVRPRRKV